jgi:hypothetical protein
VAEIELLDRVIATPALLAHAESVFKCSPLKRAKLRGLRRNAAPVLGNIGTSDAMCLRSYLSTVRPLAHGGGCVVDGMCFAARTPTRLTPVGTDLLGSGMLREVEAGWPSAVTADLTTEEIDLTDAEIRERMSGNLCRCAAYANIVPAIREVARQ